MSSQSHFTPGTFSCGSSPKRRHSSVEVVEPYPNTSLTATHRGASVVRCGRAFLTARSTIEIGEYCGSWPNKALHLTAPPLSASSGVFGGTEFVGVIESSSGEAVGELGRSALILGRVEPLFRFARSRMASRASIQVCELQACRIYCTSTAPNQSPHRTEELRL